MQIKDRFKPGVNKGFLLFLAGFTWIGVGVMLLSFASGWLLRYGRNDAWLFIVPGILAAMVIHHFGFLRVVDRNLGRISKMEGKRCAFSFMSWKSYGIVAIMVTMGILLRHSSIPKLYLSILYIGIGFALILSSVRYFRYLIRAV